MLHKTLCIVLLDGRSTFKDFWKHYKDFNVENMCIIKEVTFLKWVSPLLKKKGGLTLCNLFTSKVRTAMHPGSYIYIWADTVTHTHTIKHTEGLDKENPAERETITSLRNTSNTIQYLSGDKKWGKEEGGRGGGGVVVEGEESLGAIWGRANEIGIHHSIRGHHADLLFQYAASLRIWLHADNSILQPERDHTRVSACVCVCEK